MSLLALGLLSQAVFMVFPEARENQIVDAIPATESGEDAFFDFRTEIENAELLGQRIYDHDLAASLATDVVFEKTDSNISERAIGWIEQPLADGLLRVYFFGKTDSGDYFPVYSVDVKNGKVLQASYKYYSETEIFEEDLQNLSKARMLGASQSISTCSANYNSVVFLNADNEYYVYLLAATFDPSEIKLGGNYRFQISLNPDQVVGFQKFTNSCIAMRKGGASETVVGLVATHLLSPHPNEIHVFLSLQHKIDFYIMTVENRVLWKVANGKISLVNVYD